MLNDQLKSSSKIPFTCIMIIMAFSACTKNKAGNDGNALPIMGRTEYVKKKVNNKTVTDTVYHTIEDFSLVDQDSNQITKATFDNKIYVADFFFTTCPTICPKMKQQMLRIYKEFKNNDQVLLLSHTIDPKHDTVAVLKDYAEKLGVTSDKWHFVTGPKEEIYHLGKNSYMVRANEDQEAPGGFIHSGAFILVDKQKRIRGIYDGTNPQEVKALMADIRKLLQSYNSQSQASL